ncbi:phosphoadenylyl-sulfate reductase [Ketobacter sp. MCCC 1A13808]|uniref:phosphoadenylyl-sulfate reductase n=1 Tax=Ketobacter sp. MCCC 1A13808 TaxID=2602738 RepID=UPI000F27AA67|nr:phosphoadenylyl-sulfate reductase [Ketobacter sp. MCCC 1A13808]MVF13816.1 phosphoadenylyl-sulfate reductase [Ketobacter sp. MCCC 1A13808]RLP54869.1 MAG: phosphoadenylyl-sulfate reductase [Ketobacter sp.]
MNSFVREPNDSSNTRETNLISRVGDNSMGLSKEAIAELNRVYRPLDFEARIARLYEDFNQDKILVTSSFAATSAYFLHIISKIRPQQVVHFIDTGFHFQETAEYRNYLIERFQLKVADITPDKHHHAYSVSEQLWEQDPDLCCSVNKVQPLEEVKENYHVWVSSLMGWQTEHRASLEVFEERRGIIKFNPMIDVTKEERDNYISEHDLPFHPLVAEGYSSIGCTHCTVKGDGRAGRWQGKEKTECGLHL